MPRYDTLRITPRQPLDSSQSANVPLHVTANVANAGRGAGSNMFAVARALSSIGQDVQETIIDKSARQNAADHAAGKAKAEEVAVTGTDPEDFLDHANKEAVRGYRETDGLTHANQFEQQLQPKLARLEPGADVDAFVHEQASQYLEDANLPDTSRQAFMAAASQRLPELKKQYLKQSITESFKREEDGLQALAVEGLRSGSLLDPRGYTAWRQYGASKGLTDDEIDKAMVESTKAVIASGDVDPDKALSILQTSTGNERPPIADIPEHAEELRHAAAAGKVIRQDRAEKARYDREVTDTTQLDALKDKGILGKERAVAWGKMYDKSAAEVAAKLDQSAAARERLAEKAKKAQDDRVYASAWSNYDPMHVVQAGLKPEGVAEAGDKALTAALQSGDQGQVIKVIEHAMTTGAPVPSLKYALSNGIDESNPTEAEKYVAVYEHMRNISPGRAAAFLDNGTLAKVTQYEQAKMLGATPQQAWSRVKMGTNLDHETIAANTTAAMKLVAKDMPTSFPTEHFWQSSTPIANLGELETAYRLNVKTMVEAGASPEVAVKAAEERVKASYIRVKDRMVRSYGTGDGAEQLTSEAMSEISDVWKKRLVDEKKVDEDDPIMFVPIPGSENRWRLRYFAAGGVPLDVTHEVTVKGPDGKPRTESQFIDVIPSAVRAHYSAWKKQEDTKKRRNGQAFEQLGGGAEDLTSVTAARLEKQLRIEGAPLPESDTSPYAQNPATVEYRAKRAKLADYVADPANHTQTFADFISAQH